MVESCQKAEKWLWLDSRQACMLFVFAFTGRVQCVQQLLDGPLSATDNDSKTYFVAVARLRTDPDDEAARAMLTKVGETGTPDGVRRSAVQQLQRTYQEDKVFPLPAETERIIDGMIRRHSNQQERRRQVMRSRQQVKLLLFIMLIYLIIIIALHRYYWRSY
jgi:hypothetical protein